MLALSNWAARHGIPAQALYELEGILTGSVPAICHTQGKGESTVQSLVRLEGARKGYRLWRNNVGVLQDINGRPVRYGLANDSKQLNESLKSSDLIGWRRVTIEPHHVGHVIAQFVSRECKESNWKYRNTAREQAQMNWINLVVADGGDAKFCTGEGTL